MESKIQERVTQYVETYESLLAHVGDKDVAAALVEQIGKDSRVEMMHSEQNGNRRNSRDNGNGDRPVSGKQLAYLRRLGVEVSNPGQLTRAQASQLIDQALGKGAE